MTLSNLETIILEAIQAYEKESGRKIERVDYFPEFNQVVVTQKYDKEIDGEQVVPF